MLEGPCSNCQYKRDCSVYPVLKETLFANQAFQVGDSLDAIDLQLLRIARSWIRTVASSRTQWPAEEIQISLSALFDFLCSGLYANAVVSPSNLNTQPGLVCGNRLIFPYTWMCPDCVSKGVPLSECYLPDARKEQRGNHIRYYPRVDMLAKPGARFIGDVGFKVLMAILRVILEVVPDNIQIVSGGGRRGEFDLTIASDGFLLLGEVKAKPLIAFPLVFDDMHTPYSVGPHSWTTEYRIQNASGFLFVAASDLYIPIGPPDASNWPLDALDSVAQSPEVVRHIITGWGKHLAAYRMWTSEPNNLRWHRFGCGNFSSLEGGFRVEYRVANTKELPGLDRTDDIKKGTSQVLLFSRYKMGCRSSAIKSGLLSNLYAETHYHDYLAHLENLQVREGDSGDSSWIFDMILGLSRNIFHDNMLEELFDTTRIISRF